jgi:outer membrane protein OmpA-like peptidoglycan-associated protein
MASKKFKLFLTGFLVILSMGSFAQTMSGYDIYDSTVITKKGMAQQNEFRNNSYSYPAKPRNQWEIGVSAGSFNVFGDVDSRFPSLGFAAHVRKAFGYVFSMRLQYLNGTGKGLNWRTSENFNKNTAWNRYASPQRNNSGVIQNRFGYDGPISQKADVVYYNYKNKTQDLSLQGIITLNNVRFHKQKTGFLFYIGGGIGASAYEVKVNALDANGNPYNALFSSITNTTYENRKNVINNLKDGLDDTYETQAQAHGTRRGTLSDNTLRFSATALAGVALKLSKRINIALENRHTFMNDDLLDGQQWQENPRGDASTTGDNDSYNYLSLGLNFNLGAKSVEPLWWLNPLDYAYSELNNPKHMKLPKTILDDTDGDGVIDQLDREPNTPVGAPVDTHGVSLDTDGDGVPDHKDKQLITPTECQPVDADGVGKCPEPTCCTDKPPVLVTNCPTSYPSVSFSGNTTSLNETNKGLLTACASQLKANPTCTVTLNAYPEASKASQAVAQKRLDAMKAYLVETGGISADRISTNAEVGGGDKNTVDIKAN